ncbi:MAG: hypothetical protein PHD15_01255 [Clostridia bacterium]|nr:hypothetical protein [Clostridia bacterium]MDD4386376.1 hypothetical protein [Clostridia bacterium]
METKSTNNIIKKVMLCIFMLIFIIAICPIDLQNDTFFDISLGKKYIDNGIFTIDNFSIHSNLIYHTHHLLVNIIIYKIYSIFNFIGLHVFEIILTCIIAMLFYLLNNQFVKSKKTSYVMVFLEIIMFSIFISLRAQMFSSIIFLIEILLINKYLYQPLSKKINNIILIVLTLMPILLINFHGGVIFFYYIIIAVYLTNLSKINLIRIEKDKNIDKDKLKKLLLFSIISLPLLVLNPYGINGITYMFGTLNNSFINANIQEFQPFSLKNKTGIYMLIYFLIHICSLILSDKKIKFHEILFISGTMFMSLLSIRHFMFYIITTVVLLPHLEFILIRMKNWLYSSLNEKGPKAMTITIYIVVFFAVISVITSNLANKSYELIPNGMYPVKAVEYIKENIGYDKVIFNDYSWGSYLMLNNIKVFIDSRCDLYTKEYNKGVTVAEDYMKTLKCEVNYDDTVFKYKIEYFLIRKNEPLAIMLLRDYKYEKIYEDDISYILKKK